MTKQEAEALDEWRWAMANAFVEPLTGSGFDTAKDSKALARYTRVVAEYRRLVRDDQRPAKLGRVGPEVLDA